MNGTAEVVGAVHKTRRLAKYYDVHGRISAVQG